MIDPRRKRANMMKLMSAMLNRLQCCPHRGPIEAKSESQACEREGVILKFGYFFCNVPVMPGLKRSLFTEILSNGAKWLDPV